MRRHNERTVEDGTKECIPMSAGRCGYNNRNTYVGLKGETGTL